MTTVLSFDLGKTSCRAAVFGAGTRRDSARLDGSRGAADPDGVPAALESMRHAAISLGAGDVDAVGAGVAGLATAQHAATAVGRELAQRHGTRRVAVTSDVTVAHVGALRGGPGVVVVAGTGSVALGIGADGTAARVDGYGYLLGDAGGAFAVGRAGLDSALRAHDGRGGSPALAERAAHRFGALDAIASLVQGSDNPARAVATFATDVCELARAGEAEAGRICAGAARELVRAAEAAAARIDTRGATDVVLTGGLCAPGGPVASAFADELGTCVPRLRHREAAGDACDGGRTIALRTDLPHEHLVARPLAGPA